MRYRAVIFDMDGTLVDSLTTYQSVFNSAIAKFGLPPVKLRPLADKLNDGLNLEQIIVSFFPDHNDPEFLAACHKEVIATFRELTEDKTPLLPGVPQVLEALSSKGFKLGIATGRTTPSDRVVLWLEKVGISSFFGAVVTSADVAERKPAPDCILECARRLGVSASECLVVGDSTADIGAAKAAGAGIVAVLTGVAGKAILSDHDPLAVLEDLSELVAFLELDGQDMIVVEEPQ